MDKHARTAALLLISSLPLTGVLANPAFSQPPGTPIRQSAYLSRAAAGKVKWLTSPAAALAKARELNKPVLLDVGAVWCPWCGLMERQSYQDAETAAYINEHFVALKIDFDADPKLSAELERAQAVANLPSGLPLTAFLTPDGKLFFGGGFFPREANSDKPAFRNVLTEAVRMFSNHRSEIEKEGVKIKFGG